MPLSVTYRMCPSGDKVLLNFNDYGMYMYKTNLHTIIVKFEITFEVHVHISVSKQLLQQFNPMLHRI